MSRILPKGSIIQRTLFKVTLGMFCFVIIYFLLFGENFWRKEAIRLNYELLLAASKVETKIESQGDLYRFVADNSLAKEQKVQYIQEIIRPLLKGKNGYSIAYYDVQLKEPVFNRNDHRLDWDRVLAVLEKDSTVQEVKLDRTNLMSVPVYQGGALRGYVWVYTTNSDFTLQSFYKISLFSILALGFLVWMMYLVRKYMKQIKDNLESFSQSVVDHRIQVEDTSNQFPELKPVFNKITAYTEALETVNLELKVSKLKNEQIMQGISDCFFSLDKNWRFTFVNQEAINLFKRADKELLGKTIYEVFPPFKETDAFQKMEEAWTKNEAVYWEYESAFSQDTFYECRAYPFEEGLTVFLRDVTELRRQQKEYARLERLNLIGQMAAGISHEIRNPLTTVKGFLQLLGLKAKYADEKEHLELMISEIDRANSIITDFLSLAKANLDSIKFQDINEIIHKLFLMLQADAYSQNKEVVLELNPVPKLLLNENEIRQLLLNLVRNALEVTPESGRVTIQTYEKEGKVVLAIIDQGPGIPEEVQEKIGTPFFTTKESGTGLGLAISIGIARRHHAELGFETGKSGTVFKVSFDGKI